MFRGGRRGWIFLELCTSYLSRTLIYTTIAFSPTVMILHWLTGNLAQRGDQARRRKKAIINTKMLTWRTQEAARTVDIRGAFIQFPCESLATIECKMDEIKLLLTQKRPKIENVLLSQRMFTFFLGKRPRELQ